MGNECVHKEWIETTSIGNGGLDTIGPSDRSSPWSQIQVHILAKSTTLNANEGGRAFEVGVGRAFERGSASISARSWESDSTGFEGIEPEFETLRVQMGGGNGSFGGGGE